MTTVSTSARQLISAVKQDSLHGVRLLAHNKSALTFIDRSHFSPLHWAVYRSSLSVINTLIAAMQQRGISIDIQNRWNVTPLACAVWAGREDVVLRLIDAHANPNHISSDGFSILHGAALAGIEKIFYTLRARGANFTHVTDEGTSALLFARNMGHIALYKSLKPLNVFMTEYSRVVRQRKLISHMLGLSGATTLAHPSNQAKKEVVVALTGWWHTGIWNLIVKRNALHHDIQEACRTATNNTDTFLDRYQNGHPVIINTGFTGHYVSVVLWKHYCIIGNRGAARGRTTCEVHCLGSHQVTSSFIQTLRNAHDQSQSKYIEFLNKNFPMRHTIPAKGTIIALLEQYLSLPDQETDNCTWANAESALYTLLVMQDVLDYPADKFPSEKELAVIAKSKYRVLESWRQFMINAQVASYLRRPKKETAATNLYPEDWDFLERVKAKAPNAFVANEIASLKLLNEVRHGYLDDVKKACRSGASVHYVDGNGNSALHHAARNNRLKIAKFLISQGANVGLMNKLGETPLLQALKCGHKVLYTYMKSLDAEVTRQTQEAARTNLLTEMSEQPASCDYREIWQFILEHDKSLSTLSGSACYTTYEVEKLIAHYDKGKNPIIIHTGYIDQYVSVVVWGSIFIISDRSNDANTCEVLNINPQFIDESTIAQLQSLQGKTKNEFNEFLNKKLPSRLSPAEKGTRRAHLEYHLALKSASTTWANAEAAIYVLFVMQALMKRPTFPTALELRALAAIERQNFDSWQKSMKNSLLSADIDLAKEFEALTLL